MASPFLEAVRSDIRLRGYSIKTEKSYLYWIKFYICFNKKRHPMDMGNAEVKAFLSYLATERNVAINTQKVALNAIVFLYHKVLQTTASASELIKDFSSFDSRLPALCLIWKPFWVFDNFLCEIHVDIGPIEVARRRLLNIHDYFYGLILEPRKLVIRHEQLLVMCQ